MEWTIQLGFELEIYALDEMARMYWYLKYIAQTRSRHLERIKVFVIRAQRAAIRTPNIQIEKLQEYMNAAAYLSFSSLEAASVYELADALFCLFTALCRLGLLPSPLRPYSDDAMRYEVRMKPFLSISLPEVVPFDELTELAAQSNEPLVGILKFAADAAASARKFFEVLSKMSADEAFCRGSHETWVKNIKNSLKAAISTNITISAVTKAVEGAGKDGAVKIKAEIPQSGKGYHDFWIVPKVTPIH
jgi:hypothetical protein